MKKLYSDCETTGTDPKLHGIIQFSAIGTIDGREVDRIDIKIQPFTNDVIEDTALEVNGVTREELFASDRLTPKAAHAMIVAFLGRYCDKFKREDKFFWMGYKAAFDADFVREFFIKNGDTYYGSWFFTPPLCVMMLGAYLLQKHRSQMENFKLRTVFNFLYPEMAQYWTEEEWHDSLFDIERTMDIENALRYYARGKDIPPHPLVNEKQTATS